MADENYIDLYVDEKKDKEGITVTGKDVVQLNAPEVLLSPDTPLLTKAQDVAGAINELFNEGEGGGDDDKWVHPSDWPVLPEPADNEIILLMSTQWNQYANEALNLYANHSGSSGKYFSGSSCTVDWGDGDVQTYTLSADVHTFNLYHYYYHWDADRQVNVWNDGSVLDNGAHVFVVKIMLPDDAYLGCAFSNQPLEIYVGKNIKFYSTFSNYPYMLEHIKFFDWIPTEENHFPTAYSGLLNYAYALRKVETTTAWNKITNAMFYYCYSLDEFDFSECEEIAERCFYYCTRLKKVNAPKLISVGSYAFSYCANLESVIHGENWTTTGYAFNECYKYYDNPDMTNRHPQYYE